MTQCGMACMMDRMIMDGVAERLQNNGTDLVKLGIQDAGAAETKKDCRRYLTSILNIYAGLLLLLKSRLAEESSLDGNALIYSRFDPALDESRRVIWKHNSNRTIGFDEICQRMGALAVPGLDENFWKTMRKLRDFRNDIEHKFAAADCESLASNLIIAYDLLGIVCVSVMDQSPSEALGDEWKELLGLTEVVRHVRDMRDAKFNKIIWMSPRLKELVSEARCPECAYPVLSFSGERDDCERAEECTFKCGACGSEFEYGPFVEDLLNAEKFDDYGGRWKDEFFADRHIGICPSCERYGFDAETDMCYCCGYHCEHRCYCCGERLTIGEIESNVADGVSNFECFHCRHVREKEMGDA